MIRFKDFSFTYKNSKKPSLADIDLSIETEKEERGFSLSPGEWIKMGLVALGAMKQFAQLGGEK